MRYENTSSPAVIPLFSFQVTYDDGLHDGLARSLAALCGRPCGRPCFEPSTAATATVSAASTGTGLAATGACLAVVGAAATSTAAVGAAGTVTGATTVLLAIPQRDQVLLLTLVHAAHPKNECPLFRDYSGSCYALTNACGCACACGD